MVRQAQLGIPLLWILLLAMALVACTQVSHPGSQRGHLDVSQAFYHPAFATRPEQILAETDAAPIDARTYLRYLTARHGTRFVEDLAFDILLARECRARGLARSAPLLARSIAARRFAESGRSQSQDVDGSLQRKFANEALRRLRIDALVAADRAADDNALRALFDRLHGVGGQRVRVRQILISFAATRERLASSSNNPGENPDDAAVRAAARKRAHALRRELASASGFASLLSKSDDRATRRRLADPAHKASAGLIEGYNYQRYGQSLANTIRAMDIDEVSEPVESNVGYHLVHLVDRRTTRIEDVAAALRQELGRGPAKPSEALALRRALLQKYRFRQEPGT